jgi:hypothetical protein
LLLLHAIISLPPAAEHRVRFSASTSYNHQGQSECQHSEFRLPVHTAAGLPRHRVARAPVLQVPARGRATPRQSPIEGNIRGRCCYCLLLSVQFVFFSPVFYDTFALILAVCQQLRDATVDRANFAGSHR